MIAKLVFASAIILISAPMVQAQKTFHVFPQFVDGRFGDGLHYRSTVMVVSPYSTDTPTCFLNLYGMTATFEGGFSGSQFSINVPAGNFSAPRTLGTQAFQAGYATLTCSALVYANVLYTFYAANGTKLGESTVFSSNEFFEARMLWDSRDSSNLALAIANNTDIQRSYTVTLVTGGQIQTAPITVAPRHSLARFVSEILPPAPINGATGVLTIRSDDFSNFSAIGLRFTGGIFATIPAN